MLVAVEGCGHGELDTIYETVAESERHLGRKVDLLLICGDFQAVRNEDDLECLACPPKYRKMNTFYKYYSGEKLAPLLTIFIGGNHEASNYLQELPYGGFVAPRIYYLGYAGISGIFKQNHYQMPRHEHPPYTESTMRSVYHIRQEDVDKLGKLSEPIDIFMSHDWPAGITQYGNLRRLLDRKSFLRDDIMKNALGAPPLLDLLFKLQPEYFFSAHLHAKFPAIVPHSSGKKTHFLALSKPLPGQDFLQILDLEDKSFEASGDGCPEVKRDLEWLAILKYGSEVTEEQRNEIVRLMGGESNLVVRDKDFCRTARAYQPHSPIPGTLPSRLETNSQTAVLAERLQLDSGRPVQTKRPKMQLPPPKATPMDPRLVASTDNNPEEIQVDMDSDELESQEGPERIPKAAEGDRQDATAAATDT